MSNRKPDFVTGNTRLRARIPALHTLATLSRPREREQLARQLLRDVPGAYSLLAASVVEVLLARQDLRDVVALLRGAVRGHPTVMRRRAVRAVGRVSEPIAADVADAVDGADAVRRMITHRLPDPGLVSAVQDAWLAYEVHADLHELETTVASAAHLAWQRRLVRAGRGARAVLDLVWAERDLANLRTVLRVGAVDRVTLLPYGLLGTDELAAALHGQWTPLHRARPDWARALSQHGTGQSATLADLAVRDVIADQAGPLLRFGDAYTAEPAVGYVLAIETTARSADHRAVPGAGMVDDPEVQASWVTSS